MNKNKTFGLNELNLNVIIKCSIAGTISSLLLGVIFYCPFSYTTYIQMEYAYYAFLGLFPCSFYLAVIIAILILAAHIENVVDSLIVGFIIGLFTALLQNAVIVMVFGGQKLMFFFRLRR